MATSYCSDASHLSRNHAVLQSKSTHVGKHLPWAISIIIIAGSIVATGWLYEPIGIWSLGIGGGGLIVALVLIAIGLRNCKISSQSHTEEIAEKRRTYPKSNRKESNNGASEGTFGIGSKSLNHQSTKQLQVPMRAADIELSESLPQDIPSLCNISGRKWLTITHLWMYIEYLAKKTSTILFPYTDYMSYWSWDASIHALHKYIFTYLPSEVSNLNSLNLPICLRVTGDHWTLVYIDRERRTVEYYDSKKNYGNYDEIEQTLTVIARDLSKQEPDKPPYKFVRKIKKVLQPDTYQCGPWVLYFLEYRLIDPEFDFNQLNILEAQKLIKRYRIKVMLKIIEMYRAMIDALRKQRENELQDNNEGLPLLEMVEKPKDTHDDKINGNHVIQ